MSPGLRATADTRCPLTIVPLVVLTIIAQSGVGQLLGNLLCAVAGLLDGGPLAGLLGRLQDLLNRIARAKALAGQ